MKRGLTALVLLGAAVFWLSARDVESAGELESPAEQESAGEPDSAPDGLPVRSGPVRSILGINEAISYPRRFLVDRRPSTEVLSRHLREDAELATGVGATWTRGHTVAFPMLSWQQFRREGDSFRIADMWAEAAQSAGLQLVGMVGPWPGNHTSQHTDHFVPGNMADYADYVRQVVERYDGDGIDDMPGLTTPIHSWEFDNEPDLKSTGGPRSQERGTFCTPEEFAQVFLVTAAAIREANPNARVLNGGIYRPAVEVGRAYMRDLFAIEGVLEAIDVVSIHTYHQGPDLRTLERAIEETRSLAPGKPIWITETSVPSRGSRPWVSEAWQADMVFGTYILALASGVEKVFWHTLYDPPQRRGRRRTGLSSNSLMARAEDDTVTSKPAAKAYRALAGVLADSDWQDVALVESEGGWVVSIGENRWLAHGEEILVDLPATRASRLLGGEEVELGSTSGRLRLDASSGTLLLSR